VAAPIRVYETSWGRRSGCYGSGLLGGRGLFRVEVVREKTAWVEETIKVTGKDLLW
jgi:hypothetical protein